MFTKCLQLNLQQSLKACYLLYSPKRNFPALKLRLWFSYYRLTEAEEGVVEVENKLYLRAIIRYIVTKFGSHSTCSHWVIGVHTNWKSYIDSPVHRQKRLWTCKTLLLPVMNIEYPAYPMYTEYNVANWNEIQQELRYRRQRQRSGPQNYRWDRKQMTRNSRTLCTIEGGRRGSRGAGLVCYNNNTCAT